MSKICIVLLAAIVAVGCGGSNGPDNNGGGGGLNLTVTSIPSPINWTVGSSQRVNVKGVLATDIVSLENTSGKYEQAISAARTDYFMLKMLSGITSGTYDMIITRGDQSQNVGSTRIIVSALDLSVPDKTGMTIKGVVYSGTKGVKDVVVTDGELFTQTDADGRYWLASQKTNGLVYIVLPSGYDVPNTSSQPEFWKTIDETSPTSIEQCNFELKTVSNDNHIMLVGTDFHLANRNCKPYDYTQFENGWVKEVTANYSASATKVYCLNLGDFAWDIYWYSNKCQLDVAKATISTLPFQFWSTMGNHDNDGHTKATATSSDIDFLASGPFRQIMGPVNISMNIGKIHYILLDDIEYVNSYPGETEGDPDMGMRDYIEEFNDATLAWLEKDLSYVDKTTPVVVGYHCPICTYSGGGKATNVYIKKPVNYGKFLDLFAGFSRVELLSGHSHVNRMMPIPGYANIYERNVTAICAAWWNSSQYTGGNSTTSGINVGCDGCPAGYMIMNVASTDIKYKFKGTSVDAETQFKCYDMNEVKTYFNTNATAKSFIETGTWYYSGYDSTNPENVKSVTPAEFGMSTDANAIWINVWAWEPDAWTITAFEGSKELTVNQLWGRRDPMTNMAMGVPSWAKSAPVSSNRLGTASNPHLFEVVASSASSTVTIKVTDRYNNTYTKNFTRPAKFEASSDCWTFE